MQPLLKAAEQRILGHVENGELLLADQAAGQLIVSGVWRPDWLTRAAPELGLGGDWQRAPDQAASGYGMPSPLGRNRQVRMRWQGAMHVGVVASTNEDQVTVQVRTGGGQSYPTVRAVQCEPTDSTSGEAIEMGFYAVRAGASRLARLWLLRAHLVQGQLGVRGEQLLELLR